MNKKQIAEYFRVSQRTINNRMSEGMPFTTKPVEGTNLSENVYDLEECIEWMTKRNNK